MSTRTLEHLLAPFMPFLENHRTTDVVVNRVGEIGAEIAGQWHWKEDAYITFDALDAIATLAAFNSGQDISPSHPLCGATLPGGERIQICRPPATQNTISLAIRRPPSFRPTIEHLAGKGLFDQPSVQPSAVLAKTAGNRAELLAHAVAARKNILLAGATGSGKTTLARALIEHIPLNERLITIEDTAEWINLPHRNRVALFYSKGDQGTAKIRSEDLIEASLRMRPDRVLMQELRDGAAFSYLRGVVAGHPGCITSLHASSAEGAFDALRLMVRQHPDGRTMDDKDVKDLLFMQVDVVVHLNKQYQITDIYQKDAA
jgi:type IV secretion system protein VirB11